MEEKIKTAETRITLLDTKLGEQRDKWTKKITELESIDNWTWRTRLSTIDIFSIIWGW